MSDTLTEDVLEDEVDIEDDGPEDFEEYLDEIPVHGLLAPEGVPTGDNRQFEPGAMSSRDLPFPLRYEFVGSHGGDTSHVATVGRVDRVWRDGSNVMWSGAISTMKPYSDEVIAAIADGTARGVSVDGDEATASRIRVPVGDTGEFRDVVSYSEIRASGLTIVPIPAYQESYVSFGATPEEGIAAAAALEDCGCDQKGAFDLEGEAFTAMQETPGPDEDLPDPEDRTGALIVLIPDSNDPTVAASSEDIAHLTTVWLGDLSDGVQMDPDAVIAAVREYAANATPIVVPVRERGLLGDEDADVVFLEPTESLLAFRDGLLEIPAIQEPYAAAEQYPEWTPHVTLGYPEGVENGPASGEYNGTEVTFAGIAVWLGAEHVAFPLGDPKQDNPGEVDPDDDLEFATKGGRVGTLGAWSSPTSGTPTSSTDVNPTMSAGRGPAMSTAKDMAGSQSTATAVSDQPTGSFTSDSSGRSSPEEFSTTSATTDRAARVARLASIVDAAIHDTSSPSLTPTTSSEGKRTTLGGAASAERASMTSAFSRIESESPKGSGRAAGAATLTSDASRSAQRNADTESASATFAPGTRDGPGWITHPVPTSRIRRYWVSGKGAAKIKWGAPGDFNRCRAQLAKYVQNPSWLAGLCANMHYERLKSWPGRGAHSAVTASAEGAKPSEIVTFASREPEGPKVYDASWFKHPTFAGPTGMRIDRETGRVWGHLAAWGVCHIGIPGICQTAPRSRSNYAMFKTGHIQTTEGPVRVGKLTTGIGHANLKVRMARAVAHYDKTGAVRAFVNVGEDAYGIWFAGVLAPGLTDKQIDEFWAVGSLSGDWRTVAGSLELIAAVAVSSPGFPIPEPQFTIQGGAQVALTGAGAIPFSSAGVSSESGAPDERVERRSRVAASLRAHRVADLRARLNQE